MYPKNGLFNYLNSSTGCVVLSECGVITTSEAFSTDTSVESLLRLFISTKHMFIGSQYPRRNIQFNSEKSFTAQHLALVHSTVSIV